MWSVQYLFMLNQILLDYHKEQHEEYKIKSFGS